MLVDETVYAFIPSAKRVDELSKVSGLVVKGQKKPTFSCIEK